jgi:uncharacterized protein YcfL
MNATFRHIGFMLALVFIAALVFGCAPKQREGLGVEMNQIFLVDDFSKANVEVLKHNARRSSTGTVEIWAQLRNKSSKPIRVECRVQFLDRQQVPVEPFSAWRPVFIQGGSMATYTEISTKVQEVGYYILEIKGGQ